MTAAPSRERREPATYYDQPALKSNHWDWKVSAYIFAAGLSGGAQLVATLPGIGREEPRGGDSVLRKGRYLGLLGAAVSAPLLIADLKTPKRWYNMLRIFRGSSPMSFGSYILTSFGALSAVAALGQALGDHGRGLASRFGRLLGGAAQLPAAAVGALMACYAGVLLAATSNPLWAAAPRLLPARLAASSIAAGAAALSLGERLEGNDEGSRRLDTVAGFATAVGLGLSLLAKRCYRRRGVSGALEEGTPAALDRGALALGYGVPLACYAYGRLTGRHESTLSLVAGVSILAGSFMTRDALLRGGQASAERPRDYFRFTRRED